MTYKLAYNVADGKRRGPYWRAYYWDAEQGKTVSRYIGEEFKELAEKDFA